MATDEKVVTTKVSGDLLDHLDIVAGRLERTRSWVVREALAEWLGEEEHRHRLTLEALKSVDEGRLIDQAEIEEWSAERRNRRAKSSPTA